MTTMHYVGLDVHKKTIAYCVKTKGGAKRGEGTINATRDGINEWMETQHKPWSCAMEATLFTGWIYDHIKPHAREIKVAHPLMLRAIAAAKKKNDRVDAEKIADLLRVDLLPECYMVSEETRQLRRVLRFRSMIVHQATRLKNKISGLLMEVGEPYAKKKLHGKKYFEELVTGLQDTPQSVKELMRISRGAMEMFEEIKRRLTRELKNNHALRERVERLETIDGVEARNERMVVITDKNLVLTSRYFRRQPLVVL